MQNREFLDQCARELDELGLVFEIVDGDRYCPIAAFRLPAVPLPDGIFPRQSDLTICMPRCAGYLPDASILGLHVHGCPTIHFQGQPSRVPFADPVADTNWMKSQARYYPLYSSESGLQSMMGTHFLCLHSDTAKAHSPAGTLALCIAFLTHWETYVFALAREHGTRCRHADSPASRRISEDFVEHMVEHVSDPLRSAILSAAKNGHDLNPTIALQQVSQNKTPEETE